MLIEPTDSRLQYSGRIDFSNSKSPVLIYACSSIRMKFTGSRVGIIVVNRRECHRNFLGVILDGVQRKYELPEDTQELHLTLGEGMQNTEHEILVFKSMDPCHYMEFRGFELEEGAVLLKVPAKSNKKIEFYGDSVTVGEVSEAIYYEGVKDPENDGEYSNAWFSYAWMAARRLNAEIHNISKGGIALLDGTGYFDPPEYTGMLSFYDKLCCHPELGEVTRWNFKNFIPQVVVVAIGQNDNKPEDYMKTDYNGEKAENWRNQYRKFVQNLRKVYPDATIILTTTILEHHPNWDKAIGQVCRELKDSKIVHFLYKNNGTGTRGHIRISEAAQMAAELSEYIESQDIWKE